MSVHATASGSLLAPNKNTKRLRYIHGDGHATVFASFVDNGQPSTNDTLALTLLTKNGGLLFSSKWNCSRTIDQTIDGGNINVHLQN